MSESFIAVLDDDSLWSWGWNEHGNLSLGDTIDRKVPT